MRHICKLLRFTKISSSLPVAVILFSSLLFSQHAFAQENVLITANTKLSFSDIRSCRETGCTGNVINIVTNALSNAGNRAEEVLLGRDELQDKINRYNADVRDLYRIIDSLADVYIRNKMDMDQYDQEKKDFNDKYRFAGIPPAAPSSVSSRSSSQPASIGNMASNMSKSQKDMDDQALREKRTRFATDQKRILGRRDQLEKQRLKLVKEGTYLNALLKINTDSLHDASEKMNELVSFTHTTNRILTDELHAAEKIDAVFLKKMEVLSEKVKKRTRSAELLIETPANKVLEQVKN